MLVENAVAAAPNQLGHHLIGEAQSRSEVDEIRVNQSPVKPPASVRRCSNNSSTVGGREVRGFVIAVDERRKKFVTEAVGQSEFGSGLPSVHRIEGMSRLEVVDDVRCCENGEVHITKDEVG